LLYIFKIGKKEEEDKKRYNERNEEMKTFKPTRESLHPKIIQFFEKMKEWNKENRNNLKNPLDKTIDKLLKQFTGCKNKSFTILIQDGGKKNHGNCRIIVFNQEGIVIDDNGYFNSFVQKRYPRKRTHLGVPITNAIDTMKYKKSGKKFTAFIPPK